MRLAEVRLADYGPFRHAVWTLPPSGLVLVAGANNAGKSALLSSLDVLASPEVQEVRVHARAVGPAELTARFDLDQLDLDLLSTATSRRAESLGVVLREEAITGAYYRYRSHPDGNVIKMFPAEFGVTTADGRSISLLEHVWDDDVNREERLRGRRPGPDHGLADPHEIQTGGSMLWQSLAHFFGDLEPWKPLFDTWREQYFKFVPHRVGTDRTREMDAAPRLEPDGANLAEALLYLLSNDRAAFDNLQDVITDIVPDAGRLNAPANRRAVSVTFDDPAIDLTQNLKDLGTGVEQVVLTAYAGERTAPGSVIVIEEPESHLHAGAQRRLLRHLRRWAHDRLIIASTHSTVFLDRSGDARSHVWLVERVDGEASIERATHAMTEVLEAIGVSLSDVTSSRRLLLVEGTSDETVLTTWFAPLFRQLGVTVVASEVGSGGARWAERLDSWQQEPGARRIRFLSDRDELDEEQIATLERKGAVRVLPRRELENYLLDPHSILRYLEDLAPEAAGSVSVEAISAAMRGRADELRSTVIAKTAFGPIYSARVVDRAAVAAALAATPPRTGDDAVELVKGLLADPSLLLGVVEERWDRVAKEIDQAWEDRWPHVAPGEELLDAAFGLVGRRYRKTRDAALLAAQHEPPPELEALLEKFLG